MPKALEEEDYHNFVLQKTAEIKMMLQETWKNEHIFKFYEKNEEHNGFYVIVKLSQDPSDSQIENGIDAYLMYIEKMRSFLTNKSVTSYNNSDSDSDTISNKEKTLKKKKESNSAEDQDSPSGCSDQVSENEMLEQNEQYFFDVF